MYLCVLFLIPCVFEMVTKNSVLSDMLIIPSHRVSHCKTNVTGFTLLTWNFLNCITSQFLYRNNLFSVTCSTRHIFSLGLSFLIQSFQKNFENVKFSIFWVFQRILESSNIRSKASFKKKMMITNCCWKLHFTSYTCLLLSFLTNSWDLVEGSNLIPPCEATSIFHFETPKIFRLKQFIIILSIKSSLVVF